MEYEYRVVPAPKRLKRIKGVSSTPDLVAATLTDCINAEARQGWEFLRTEQVSAEEPASWFRRARPVEEAVMIFRRQRHIAEPGHEAPREPAAQAGAAVGPQAGAALRARMPAAHQRIEEGREARIGLRQPAHQPPTAPATPPLLRPVPRHSPGEKG